MKKKKPKNQPTVNKLYLRELTKFNDLGFPVFHLKLYQVKCKIGDALPTNVRWATYVPIFLLCIVLGTISRHYFSLLSMIPNIFFYTLTAVVG